MIDLPKQGKFQFHSGLIKSAICFSPNVFPSQFQFHSGLIKRNWADDTVFTVIEVSIPFWSD